MSPWHHFSPFRKQLPKLLHRNLKFDLMDFDRKATESIAHLQLFPNLFFLQSSFCKRSVPHLLLALLSSRLVSGGSHGTSQSADYGDNKDLRISHDWIANNISFRTRSFKFHDVKQPSFSKAAAALVPGLLLSLFSH